MIVSIEYLPRTSLWPEEMDNCSAVPSKASICFAHIPPRPLPQNSGLETALKVPPTSWGQPCPARPAWLFKSVQTTTHWVANKQHKLISHSSGG